MKQNMLIALYIGFAMVLADYMVNRIFDAGIVVGKFARDNELDKIGKRTTVSKVLGFPFGKRNVTTDIEKENHNASQANETDVTETNA